MTRGLEDRESFHEQFKLMPVRPTDGQVKLHLTWLGMIVRFVDFLHTVRVPGWPRGVP